MKTRKRLRKRGGALGQPPPARPLLRRTSSVAEQDNITEQIIPIIRHQYEPEENNEEYSIPEIDNNIMYIDDTHVEAPGYACCSTPMCERLEIIDNEISKIHTNYVILIQGLADKIYSNYADTNEMEPANRQLPERTKIEEWNRESIKLLYGYQRLSIEDIKIALFMLLPQFNLENGIYTFENGKTTMQQLVQNYAYKMITSLFTTANITAAVFLYSSPLERIPDWTVDALSRMSPPWTPSNKVGCPQDKYMYLRNLLSIMKCGSTIINEKLEEHWDEYFNNFYEGGGNLEYDNRCIYYHSGGNMIVMIAGILCYLHEKNLQSPGVYDTDILGRIRNIFDNVLGQSAILFYTWLNVQMTVDEFRKNLYSCTENLSDLDFIFFAPSMEEFDTVQHLDTDFLIRLNQLSARIIREVIIDSCNERTCARALMPFHGLFDIRWPPFKFCSMTSCDMHMPALIDMHIPALSDLTEPCLSFSRGYRQTSNRIDAVPMYLNRLKQGYLPFYSLSGIPFEYRSKYASKYGECIDLSIGTLDSSFYQHKHDNYKNNKYYSIETILWELKQILSKTFDDKTPKRQMRLKFLLNINLLFIDILFKVIAHVIQNYNTTPAEDDINLDTIIMMVPQAVAEYSAMTATNPILSQARTNADMAAAEAAENSRDAMRSTRAIREASIRDVSEAVVKTFSEEVGKPTTPADVAAVNMSLSEKIDNSVKDVVSAAAEAAATAAVEGTALNTLVELSEQEGIDESIIKMSADLTKKALSKAVGELAATWAMTPAADGMHMEAAAQATVQAGERAAAEAATEAEERAASEYEEPASAAHAAGQARAASQIVISHGNIAVRSAIETAFSIVGTNIHNAVKETLKTIASDALTKTLELYQSVPDTKIKSRAAAVVHIPTLEAINEALIASQTQSQAAFSRHAAVVASAVAASNRVEITKKTDTNVKTLKQKHTPAPKKGKTSKIKKPKPKGKHT